MALQTSNTRPGLHVLEINASARATESVSRALATNVIDALELREGELSLTRRNLDGSIGPVDEAWVEANFTADEERTTQHRETLSQSDSLVAELQRADVLVIGTPIYNFGVPATLKAWVDMICRARLTFRYTDDGPEGLLKDKRAYIVVASGGVPVDSAVDFATPYLRQVLRFVGITDIQVVAADQLNARGSAAVDSAREQIAQLIQESPVRDRAA